MNSFDEAEARILREREEVSFFRILSVSLSIVSKCLTSSSFLPSSFFHFQLLLLSYYKHLVQSFNSSNKSAKRRK